MPFLGLVAACFASFLTFWTVNMQTPQWYMLRRQICKAHCSIAELYLTDLCFEEDAEQSCEAAVARAAEVEEDSLEVHQVRASLLISQQRKPEAAQHVKHVGEQLLEMRNAANDEENPNEGESTR
jgi:hypothetical protein